MKAVKQAAHYTYFTRLLNNHHLLKLQINILVKKLHSEVTAVTF